MVKLAAQLVPLKVNAEKEGVDLAKTYKVQGYPTILFLNAEGKVRGEIGGYLPPEEFSIEMQKFIELNAMYPKLLEESKSANASGESFAKLAWTYGSWKETKEAEASLAKAESKKYKGEYLAKACNAIGDIYQMSEEIDKAIPLFKKADSSAVKAEDRSYAKISLLFCYLSKQDVANAKRMCNEIIKMKDAVKSHVETAKEILKELGGG